MLRVMASTEDHDEVHRTLSSLRRGNAGRPIETSNGTAFPFKSPAIQIPMLVGALAGGPTIVWLLGHAFGTILERAEIFRYVFFALVFFLGYGMWAARLASLVVTLFGRKALWALVGLLFRRTEPRDLQQFLPDRDALTAFLVSVQKAAWSFLIAGVSIGIVGGILA